MTNSANSKKRGRPVDPNKLAFQSIGLRPAQRAYLRRWRLNPDNPTPIPNSPEDNATLQIGLLIDAAMKFWPDGSNYSTAWPRDKRGRFTTNEPPPDRGASDRGGEGAIR